MRRPAERTPSSGLLVSTALETLCFKSFFSPATPHSTPLLPGVHHFHSSRSFPFQSTCCKNDPVASSTRHFNRQHSRYPLSLFSATSIPFFSRAWIEVPPSRKLDARTHKRTANFSTQQKARTRRRRGFGLRGSQQELETIYFQLEVTHEHDKTQLEMIKKKLFGASCRQRWRRSEKSAVE